MSTHQSLYRQFRPQRFSEVIGQPHLVRALLNAVREDRVGHAYLLSGPRGTGKTSTARILAKALNCEALDDGEPCGECPRCTPVASGTSLDLIELDAASNNSVNHVREITERAALASPGRRKVYLLDEVHMLSTAASNALLKTLEEPPAHVVFILATTDPQKVLPTIRSRTQQFGLSLVGPDEMESHVRAVAEKAGANLDDSTIEYAVDQGRGSVRDALSALDTVLAAGCIPQGRTDAEPLVRALGSLDFLAMLTAIADAAAGGADIRAYTERTANRLREVFLTGAGVKPAEMMPSDIDSARELAKAMGRRINVQALETLGVALARMPQSNDHRTTLETALAAMVAANTAGEGSAAPAALAPIEAASQPASTPPPAAAEQPAHEPKPQAAAADASRSPADVAETQHIWATQVIQRLRPVAAGLFRDAQVVGQEDDVVAVKLPKGVPADQARRRSEEAGVILSEALNRPVRLEVSD